MTANIFDNAPHLRYARAISASKKARWEIDRDVLRDRSFDLTHKFLPDGLSLVQRLDFLSPDERRFFSQVQGRTYAGIFGLVERFINAKVLEVAERHALGDQTALEALVRFSDEELKHQELFRRVEQLAARGMPSGYRFDLDPNQVATVVLSKSSWSVLALTCLIELFTQVHYKRSIQPDPELSPLFKDVFRFHWMEESQHAVLDELEWTAEDTRLDGEQRRQAVSDLIALVSAVDGLLQAQASSDASYFIAVAAPRFDAAQESAIRSTFLAAYRHQYIFSGVEGTQFVDLLRGMIDEVDFQRIALALATLR